MVYIKKIRIYKWSRKFTACVVCHDTKSKHRAFGICTRCHEKERSKSPARKEYKRKYSKTIRTHGFKGKTYKLPKSIVAQLDNPVCYYCDKDLIHAVKGEVQIDHIDPFGDNSETNLVVSCRKCNRLKSQQTVASLTNFLERMTRKMVIFQ